MIKIDFEFDTPHGVFRDAIYLPDDHPYTEGEIQAMKEQRRDNWVACITAPNTDLENPPVLVDGFYYFRLEGVPPLGAKLIEIDGVWFYRV